MKRIIIILAFLVCGISSAQQYFFNGTVYVPKTTAQISAIVSPPEGRVEANSDTGSLWYFDGTIWKDTFVGVSSFEDLEGDPYDNENLESALNAKANDNQVIKIDPESPNHPALAFGNEADLDNADIDGNTVEFCYDCPIATDGFVTGGSVSGGLLTLTMNGMPNVNITGIGGGGGSAEWGNIGGTISNQTDLIALLNGKANSSHTHNASDITAGTLAIGRIPTGSTGSTVALGNHNHNSLYVGLTGNQSIGGFKSFDNEVSIGGSEDVNALFLSGNGNSIAMKQSVIGTPHSAFTGYGSFAFGIDGEFNVATDNGGQLNRYRFKTNNASSTIRTYTFPDKSGTVAMLDDIASGGGGDMLKSENLSGLANYTTARSNLGLGSLATKSTIVSSDITNGTIIAEDLASNSITTVKISDGNVTNAKIDTGVNAAKIANGSVSNTEFQYLDATTSNIQQQLNDKLSTAAGAVGTTNLATNAVTTAKITDGNVTSAKLANTTVTPGTYSSANVTVNSKGQVTSIQNGGIPYINSGSFTPTIHGGESGTAASLSSGGNYTKIGRMVFFTASATFSMTGATGELQIRGLPLFGQTILSSSIKIESYHGLNNVDDMINLTPMHNAAGGIDWIEFIYDPGNGSLNTSLNTNGNTYSTAVIAVSGFYMISESIPNN